MAIQLSVGARNAELAAIFDLIGADAVLKLRTGAAPADVATADSGSVLVSMTLPTTYVGSPSSGSIGKSGAWSGVGLTEGDAAHFRIYEDDGTTAHLQGTVTITGGGGDMTLDNDSIATDQVVTITSFALTAGNA